MRHTERKSVLGATNLLRNYRECHDQRRSVIVFAISNATLKHCITEIEVEWKDFTFQVSMERFPILQDGIERIKQVLKHNCKYSHGLQQTI